MVNIILLILLIGCGHNQALHTLIPKHYPSIENFDASFKVIGFESVKSANMPLLKIDGTLGIDKKIKWLRSPEKLLQEYLNVTSNTSKTEKEVIIVILEGMYWDDKDKLYKAQIRLKLKDQNYTFKSKGLDPSQVLKDVADMSLDHILKSCKV